MTKKALIPLVSAPRLGKWILSCLFWFLFPFFILVVLAIPKRKRKLISGPVPIMNHKYNSAALKGMGYEALTLMDSYYGTINRRDDFDLYFEDLLPPWIRQTKLKYLLGPLLASIFVFRNARVVFIPFSGGPLGHTPFWRVEGFLFHLFGIHSIVLAHGFDVYAYSTIFDASLRKGLLSSYPDAALHEKKIRAKVDFWVRNGSFLLPGFMLDGIGRWNTVTAQVCVVDTDEWKKTSPYTFADGRNGPVRILHAPNHQGFKGTEFLVAAIDLLRMEGLKVELIFAEKVQNSAIRDLMQTVDIHADQFIASGYALSAIEGMSCGLPVVCNLDSEYYLRVFRRFSYLNECPIVSANPEDLKRILRVLITQPELRRTLGSAGRTFALKYHSFTFARYLYPKIIKALDNSTTENLMNLFHPLTSEYSRLSARIQHPLFENRLPPNYFDTSTESGVDQES